MRKTTSRLGPHSWTYAQDTRSMRTAAEGESRSMHEDREIPGWFPEINRNHLIWLMWEYEIQAVLEVGAFLGKSTVFFAQRCQFVHSVDFWDLDRLSCDEYKFAKELGLPRQFKAVWVDNVKQACHGRNFLPSFLVSPANSTSLPTLRTGRIWCISTVIIRMRACSGTYNNTEHWRKRSSAATITAKRPALPGQ